MPESPRIDLPLPPAPPIPPPPPLPTEPTARVSVAYNAPVSQLPGVGHQLRGIETPGVSVRDRQGVQYLAEVASDPDKTAYRLDIYRIGPPVYDGIQLPCGLIESRTTVLPYLDLYERVRSIHGGGDFRISVIDDMGKSVKLIPFRIETLNDPPKAATLNGSQKPVAFSPLGRGGANGIALSQEEEEIQKLRLEERSVAALQALKSKKREMAEQDRQYAEREEAIEERKAKKTLEPVQQVRSEMAQMMQSQQQQFQQMLTMITTMLKPAPQDNSHVQVMIESMRSQQAQMTAMMTLMMNVNQTKSADQAEQYKMKVEQDRALMEMMFKAMNGNGNNKYEKLFEQMVTSIVTKPKSDIQDAIKLMQMGREQALELMEFRREGSEEDFDYDPRAGVLGNFGKLLFMAFKSIMKSGAGGPAMAALLGAMNKQGPEQVQTADLAKLAGQLESQAVAALPPAQVQQLQRRLDPQPQPPLAANQPVGTMFPGSAPVQVVSAAVQQAASQQAVVSDLTEIFEDEEPLAQQQVPAVEPEIDSLKSYVTEAMKIALDDLKAGRRDAEWAEFATGKWPKNFLDVLCGLDNAGRIEAIKQQCEKPVFDELYQRLLDAAHPEHYRMFLRALQSVVTDHGAEHQLPVTA